MKIKLPASRSITTIRNINNGKTLDTRINKVTSATLFKRFSDEKIALHLVVELPLQEGATDYFIFNQVHETVHALRGMGVEVTEEK
jgi:hypothetical protein